MKHPPPRHLAPPPGPSLPAHARALPRTSMLRIVGLVTTAVLVFVGFGVATAAVNLTGNIDAVDAEEALGTDRPEKVAPEDPSAGEPLNILILGSDSRDGSNSEAVDDGTEGARSDTTVVMHLAADRSRVELMSIPRDTTSDIPACPTSSGRETPPLYGVKFNAAFAQGVSYGGDVESGALCTMKTVESMTDVRLDGFVVVDFSGFEGMIDALNGVDLCIPNDIYAPKAGGLRLDSGVQTLDGSTALQYARARTGEGLGDGSDIGRIGRQQELMAALARTVLSQNLLTNSPQLLQFLDAVTGSLTMSSNLASIQGLAGLAYSARDVRPDTIAFMTVPWQYDPSNRNNVVLVDEAQQVFDNLRNDVPLSDVFDPAPASDDDTSTGNPGADGGRTSDEPDASTDEETGPAESGSEADEPPDTNPSPTETRDPREEAFTGADVTAVCG
ncbi:LCP family protein [Isoptericola haloaureus]|uniref:LCP family protein n=1 Tax=Isoptericola haloaureus TaxID=1542902 RepID=A0ABU7Z4X4_9MICO